MLSIGMCSQLACIWEATARKPGNVHRFQDFEKSSYLDFLLSAAALGPILENARRRPVGETVLKAVRATRGLVATNTNLGIILLLAPLASVPRRVDLQMGVINILDSLTVHDSRAVYEAIRLAHPAGLGSVTEQDIQEEPTETLRQVMARAAGRDLVARQYANRYQEVFGPGLEALQASLAQARSLEEAIITCHVNLMAWFPDSLIARKRGLPEAREAARLANRVLKAHWPQHPAGRRALGELDAWLRAHGSERNPGTTADLVTASLFVALRQKLIVPPQQPWSSGPPY